MQQYPMSSKLSEQGRRALETVSGLPLVSVEQQDHAWQILLAEIDVLGDPQTELIDDDACDLFVSGPELAALRVMIAWLKGSDRAGLQYVMPVHLAVAEALVAQLGAMPWLGVWEPSYLRSCQGGTLWLCPETEAPALLHLLEDVLAQPQRLCPGWPADDRALLTSLLCDVWYWLHTMAVVYEH